MTNKTMELVVTQMDLRMFQCCQIFVIKLIKLVQLSHITNIILDVLDFTDSHHCSFHLEQAFQKFLLKL